ncbi:nuclear transport factor 2 family protein [Streptomyces acidicola]|uniref:nuclear transport factor 2 family protein n=1 Tax=Streptomyces acidicola TaxID=2596892 RepID=UPI0037F7EFA7
MGAGPAHTALYHHYDRLEYDAVLEFFAPDALYELRGRKIRGRAEILDVLNARPGPEQTTRHIVATQHFHAIGDTTAQGAITLLGYRGPRHNAPPPTRRQPADTTPPHSPPDPYPDPRLMIQTGERRAAAGAPSTS